MVTELANVTIKTGLEQAFEKDFSIAIKLIASSKGYIKHSLQRCIEEPQKYIFLIQWENIQDHMEGFRKSPQYVQWRNILYDYFAVPATVFHYETIMDSAK